MRYLTVPGIGGSGPRHWQSLWEAEPCSTFTRFSPASWDEPDPDDWLAAVRRAVAGLGPDVVVVAHSLGCLAVAHLAAGDLAVRGIVLVAPPDVDGPRFPVAARRFVGLAADPVRVPALAVTSADDPFCTPEVAARLVTRWGAERVDVGPHGHLNEASGLGRWEVGRELVERFAERTPDPGPVGERA